MRPLIKVAIASGKGGTGKTTLAVNLASYLKDKVILADLDVEEPNSGIFLNKSQISQKNIYRPVPEWDKSLCINCGKCVDYCRFNALLSLGKQIIVLPELCHSCFVCSDLCPANALPMSDRIIGELIHYNAGSFDFIESKLNIGEAQAVPLIDQTLKHLDFFTEGTQILDCPPGTSCSVMAATKDADLVLLVTEPTPFGLHDLTLAVETMRKLKKSFAVIINRWEGEKDMVVEYCEREKISIVAKIPNLRTIAELYSRGELLYEKVPEFQQALDEIITFVKNSGGEI